MAVSGLGIGMAAAGALVAYAGITNQPIADALRDVLKGTPKKIPDETPAGWRDALIGGNPAQTTVSTPYTAAGGAVLADAALKYVGRPYRWGGNFDLPNGGGDCSGLVYRAFHDLEWFTPRLPANGYPTWTAVRKDATATPGDILWWPGHVAIVVDQGNMVEAPTFGIPVRVVPIRRGYLALRPQLDALQKYVYHTTLRGPV